MWEFLAGVVAVVAVVAIAALIYFVRNPPIR